MCLYRRAPESFCTLHKHKYGSQEDLEEASKEDIKQMIFLLVLKSEHGFTYLEWTKLDTTNV